MLVKCPHDNVTIVETARAYIAHVFEGGEYKFSDHYTGLEFTMLWVLCSDCGLDRAYSKYHLPKWLKRKWEEIHSGTD